MNLIYGERQIAINYEAPYYTVFFLLLFDFFFFCGSTALVSLDLLLVEVSRSHSDTQHSVGLLRTSVRPVAETSTTQHSQETDIHVPGGTRTHYPSQWITADSRLRPRGHWDRNLMSVRSNYSSQYYGEHSWYSNSLRTWRSGNGIPVGARFSSPGQKGPWDHPASYTKGTGSFPVVKRPGSGVNYTLPSTTNVKERVDLQLFSPYGPSWPVLG